MFPIRSRSTVWGYEFCELVVHGEITTYRRKLNDEDNWEVQRPSGEGVSEDILNEIVTELFDSVADNYSCWRK